MSKTKPSEINQQEVSLQKKTKDVIAIEVDGDNAYMVRSRNGVVTQTQLFEEKGLLAALASLGEKEKNNLDIRIALNERMSLSITNIERGQVDFSNLNVISAIIRDLASKELGNSAVVSAKTNYAMPKADGYEFTLMGIAKPQFDFVVDQVGAKPYSLLPVIGVGQLNGVHIHLGRANSAIYYIEDTVPKHYSSILQGELKFIYENKEDGSKLLAGDTNVSPALKAAYASYLTHIAERISSQIVSWQSESQAMDTSTIWLHGLGSQLPGVAQAISIKLSTNIVVPSIDANNNISSRFYIAHLLAEDKLDDPIRSMVNPKWEETKLLKYQSVTRSKTALKILAALFVVVLIFSSYIYVAIRAKNSAASQLASNQTQEQTLAPKIATYEFVQQKSVPYTTTAAQLANWGTVWAFIAKTTPFSAQVSSVSFTQKSNNLITVSFSASVFGASPFNPVADWVSSLKQNGALNVTVGSITFAKDTQAEKTNFSFDVPVRSQLTNG